VPVIFFALLLFKLFFVIRARLHLLSLRRPLALLQWYNIRQVFKEHGNVGGFEEKLDKAREGYLPISESSSLM
jgi:hypothetical protein